MKKLILRLSLVVLVGLATYAAATAHNPDGSLTASEQVAIAIEEDTIHDMQLTIVSALQENPINWVAIWLAQIVIEEAWDEIDAIENHE